MSGKTKNSSISRGASRFKTTHWSIILAASHSSSTDYQKSISTLCQTYRYPLYAFLRRQGYDTHHAEDYLQGFFAALLEKHYLQQVDPKRGRFRSFLLASLKHFVTNECVRDQAKKRGGDRTHFSLDIENAENQYSLHTSDQLSAQKLYERTWALTLLERTLTHLQEEWSQTKKPEQFEHLKVYLTAGKDSVPYRDMANHLGMTEEGVRVAVHRLRRRYRDLLRDEIAQTVSSEEQIEEEIRDLFTALA